MSVRYEFGANPFSVSQDISYTKKHRLMAPKREFPQFTACGNNWQHELATSYFHWNFFKRAYKSWFLGYKCVGVHILDGMAVYS